jgi:hypothetical protein
VAFDGRVWTAKDSPEGWVTDRGAAKDVVVIRAG